MASTEFEKQINKDNLNLFSVENGYINMLMRGFHLESRLLL